MEFRPKEAVGYWHAYAQRCVAYAFAEALKACCLEHQKPYVITPSQYGVLTVLYNDDGQTIGTIGQKCIADAPTATGVVKRLEQSALVERRHDLQDRRNVKVYLTGEARDFMPFLIEAVFAFNAIMTRGFSEAEKKDLIAKLQQIIVNVSPDTGDRFGLLPRRFRGDREASLAANSITTNISREKEGAL
jgi:MarR family transcriptional regulator, organic hydroperoxide resistance regulator